MQEAWRVLRKVIESGVRKAVEGILRFRTESLNAVAF